MDTHRQSNAHNGPSHNDQHSEFYGGMTRVALWYQLINHGVSRHGIDKKPILFLLALYTWKHSQTNKRKATLAHGRKESWIGTQFPDLSQFVDPLNDGTIWKNFDKNI